MVDFFVTMTGDDGSLLVMRLDDVWGSRHSPGDFAGLVSRNRSSQKIREGKPHHKTRERELNILDITIRYTSLFRAF